MRSLGYAGILVLATFLASSASSAPPGPKPSKEPETYQVTVPGVVTLTLAAGAAEFRTGQAIVLTKRLVNIGTTPFSVDQAALSEGFAIQSLEPGKVCGVLGDHPTRYRAEVRQLAPGAATTSSNDLSSNPCYRGAGWYQLRGSYCHYDGKVATHGSTRPIWCVQAEPLIVHVVDK